MITATSFQTLPVRQADSRAAQCRNPWEGQGLPPSSRNDASAFGYGSRPSEGTHALKAAVALLTAENKTLQENLEAERKFSAELRLALESLRQAATTDPLTGLYNRRAMDQQLNELLAGQNSAPLSILMLDIDHFKRINDTYGHPSGDQVIRQVAETLRRCLRAEDSAFRYGGEEFMVLLPNTPLDGAIRVAESIRGRVAALHMAHRMADRADGLMQCTVSLGVASRKDRDDGESLFQRADRALYQAKHQGRNRVVPENLLN